MIKNGNSGKLVNCRFLWFCVLIYHFGFPLLKFFVPDDFISPGGKLALLFNFFPCNARTLKFGTKEACMKIWKSRYNIFFVGTPNQDGRHFSRWPPLPEKKSSNGHNFAQNKDFYMKLICNYSKHIVLLRYIHF